MDSLYHLTKGALQFKIIENNSHKVNKNPLNKTLFYEHNDVIVGVAFCHTRHTSSG
jgi:hypothetical protein